MKSCIALHQSLPSSEINTQEDSEGNILADNSAWLCLTLTFWEGAVVGLEGVGGGGDRGVGGGGGSGGSRRGPGVLHGLLEVEHGVLRRHRRERHAALGRPARSGAKQ